MPIPCAGNYRLQIRVGWVPAQHVASAGSIRHESIRIAGASRGDFCRNGVTGHAAGGLDDIFDRVAGAVTEIKRPGGIRGHGQDMGLG